MKAALCLASLSNSLFKELPNQQKVWLNVKYIRKIEDDPSFPV